MMGKQRQKPFERAEEWKGHESVAQLIDAEVRPPLRECLEQVAAMLQLLSNKLTHQEEARNASKRLVFYPLSMLSDRFLIGFSMVSSSFSKALHLAVTGVVTYFSQLGRRQELLKKRVEEFEATWLHFRPFGAAKRLQNDSKRPRPKAFRKGTRPGELQRRGGRLREGFRGPLRKERESDEGAAWPPQMRVFVVFLWFFIGFGHQSRLRRAYDKRI